jgi:hypothetical protein
LLKLFIQHGKDANKVKVFLEQPETPIPNSVPISKLREQIDYLSQIEFPNHGGKVDKLFLDGYFYLKRLSRR